MSSWLVSLRWIGGRIARACRWLEKCGFDASCVLDSLFDAGPCRLVAEPAAQIIQQRSNLAVVHAACKTRHDRAAFALHGANPRQHDVGGIARVGTGEGGGEREIDAAIG